MATLIVLLLVAGFAMYYLGKRAEHWKGLAKAAVEEKNRIEQERLREEQIRIFAEKEAKQFQERIKALEARLSSMSPNDPWVLPFNSDKPTN